MRRRHFHLTAMAGLLCIAGAASASATDFYAGKTIEIMVGSSAGGGFDIYARALARYWGNHIAGHPTFVIWNMPGAGGGRAAAYVSTVAPKDGTVLGAPMPGTIVGPLLDDKPQLEFDPTKVLISARRTAGNWSSSSAIRLSPSQIRACRFPAPGSSQG